MIELIVDEKEIKTEAGKSILQACLENGIFIPNLCFIKTREHPHASCRLCFVEIDGFDRPVTSCTEKVREGMVVQTDTPPVRRLQRMAFKLLMSGHPCEAKVCPVKGGCQLIRIAKHLKVGLNPKPLEFIDREVEEEVDLTFFTYYPFGFFGSTDPVDLPCHSCLACATICPTGALIPKPELTKGAKSNP